MASATRKNFLCQKGLDRLFDQIAAELENEKPADALQYLINRLGQLKERSGGEDERTCPDYHPEKRWHDSLDGKALTIVVLGASGDLARKKTFPALYRLFLHGMMPPIVNVVGYARSQFSREEFVERISEHLEKDPCQEAERKQFLMRCHYISGGYSDDVSFPNLATELEKLESQAGGPDANRVFYFALPPTAYLDVALRLRMSLLPKSGFSRLIVEKPFGRDYKSAKSLADGFSGLFSEDQIYRIDHYLGKEMVQNLISVRFANKVFSSVWNSDCISSVSITFKENIGTEGRGGYFDQYGIIRDILQNHLLQILTLVAMEKPKALTGDAIRDEKVHVLRAIRPAKLEDCVLGQYGKSADGKKQAYLEDSTVPKDSLAPTFSTVVLWVDNDRWFGVPFILKAGKALDVKKTEVRIQFKSEIHPFGSEAKRDELVLRVQPDEAIYLKMMTKLPGVSTMNRLIATDLDLSYHTRYEESELPKDAYDYLLYDALGGQQGNFVRTDELLEAWKVFTPLLEAIESNHVKPIIYPFGSRGPAESDELIGRVGFVHEEGYHWRSPYARS